MKSTKSKIEKTENKNEKIEEKSQLTVNISKKKDNRSKKKSFQKIAQARIIELFEEAEKLFKINPEYANNCMKLARKISLRYKVPFSKEQKLRFCKNCESFLVPNNTSRVRVSDGKIKILCLGCKHIQRYRYK